MIEETVGGTSRRHLVGLGLDEVYATRSTTSGVVSEEYLLHDALNNSVVASVDAVSKNVKSGFGYTPFGKGFATHSVATNNPLLFAGAEANEFGSAIHYLRGRYYTSALGRFLSEDPIGLAGGDTNLYRYVFNRPHVDYDPTGLGGGVPTFAVGIEEGFASPFVESFALGAGDLFVLQATLQSSVGATGTRGYLGTPEDVSVNPVGGVPKDTLIAGLPALAIPVGLTIGELLAGGAVFVGGVGIVDRIGAFLRAETGDDFDENDEEKFRRNRDNTPDRLRNREQRRSERRFVRGLERRLDKDKDKKRRIHDEITKGGYTNEEIEDIADAMFPKMNDDEQ